jgi:glycosyltransferase involved in cell wall biosynthesis
MRRRAETCSADARNSALLIFRTVATILVDMREVPIIAEGLFSFQFGGSERVGLELALEFKRRGYRVICFAFHGSEGPLRTQLEEAGIRCLDMNYEKFHGIFRRVAYLWKFWRMLRQEGITALHVHHAGALILCGIPAWLARINRVVMTEHALAAFLERPEARRLAVSYCPYASDITVVEPAQADYFHTQLGIPTNKLHYVPNGVRVLAKTAESVASMRRTLGVPGEVFAFFFVGRLYPVKDLGTLLNAFAALPLDVLARSRLYLVGDGPERAALEARRDALGLREKVLFLGARGDVAEVLAAADALVMSSKSEGLPMVLLEAMAAGVPCVATAVGGIPRLFGDDRGVSVPARNSSELASAMATVARSPELRERLVQNAMENLRKNYAFDTIADRYLELLGLPPRIA